MAGEAGNTVRARAQMRAARAGRDKRNEMIIYGNYQVRGHVSGLGGAPTREGPIPAPVRHRVRSPHRKGAVSDLSETAPDLRLSRVGTTGFEPATP
ncbi:protein of unknown function [Streptomyces murinus]